MRLWSHAPQSPAETEQFINMGDGDSMVSSAGTWEYTKSPEADRAGMRPFELLNVVSGRVAQVSPFLMGTVHISRDEERLREYPVAAVVVPPFVRIRDRISGALPEGKAIRVALDPELTADIDSFFMRAAATAVYNHVNGTEPPECAGIFSRWDAYLSSVAQKEAKEVALQAPVMDRTLAAIRARQT